jgi:hypothetical protein
MPTRKPRVRFNDIERLVELFDYTIAFALRVAARLGVADHLADGPRSLEDLARITATDPPSLRRLLRTLSSKGVFVETDDGSFALTGLAQPLRSDHPTSLRHAFRVQPDLAAIEQLEYSVRTGLPSFDRHHGQAYFPYLAEHDELREEFRGTQAALTGLELIAALRVYPWKDATRVVDVGGNDGTFLAAILRQHPSLHGTVFDLPDTVAEAPKVLADAGVLPRCEVVSGDLLHDPLPEGGDLYLIKRVLVGFDDEAAVEILRRMGRAAGPGGTVLVIEPMSDVGADLGMSLDILMLVLGTGRVRTPTEFRALFERAGLTPARTIPAGIVTIVEATA